jgi:tetratricopeptide (TPR) repeat protein
MVGHVHNKGEENAMRDTRMLACILLIMVSVVSVSAFAEEELVDTKAAEKHIEKGIAHLKAKNYDAAVNEFEESAAILPEAESYYYLGYAYYMKGRKQDGDSRKKSIENFEKAYEIDPNFTPSRFKPAEPVPAKQDVASAPKSAPTATPESSPTPTTSQPAP